MKTIREALKDSESTQVLEQYKWRALAFILREMCLAGGIDLDYESKEDELH